MLLFKQKYSFYGLLLLAAVLACACTPTFDWRTQRFNAHGDQFSVTFPGKALSAQKNVLLNQETSLLTLYGVQAASAQFVLGQVPARNAAHAQALAQGLAQAFSSNLGAAGVQQTVSLAKTQGAFELRYALPQRQAHARFIWTANAAYELLVIGPAGDLASAEVTPDIVETFTRSLQFE
jgi:hypothetical protein